MSLLFCGQPLSRSLNADVPEQLITPLVSLGHISMLAPDQFASPMKSIVANFIVKDLLMNDRVRPPHSWSMLVFLQQHSTKHVCLSVQMAGNKNGKLWTSDEEVSPEVLAKVRKLVVSTKNKNILSPNLFWSKLIVLHIIHRFKPSNFWCDGY